jgi:plasmid stability protein
MREPPSQSQDKFIVRLPDGMRERIKAEAEANNRSMNAEIVARLDASFERDARTQPDLLVSIDAKLGTLLERLEGVGSGDGRP